MPSKLLFENEQRRLEIPLWQLLCFVMFCVWQMGIIYYIGPALNIDGRTPLPISADNLTMLIVAGYIFSILSMIFLPHKIILLSRISTVMAFVSAIGLFFPLGTTALTLLICIQCFCCCYMIGFESATMVHYFTQQSVTRHLLIAYPIGYTLIALIQNDFVTLSFSVFRILMILMLMLLVFFYFTIPINSGIHFVSKKDGLLLPKQFLIGLLLLSFLSALLGVIAPAAAAEFSHGVFAAYLGCAAGSVLLYLLYKRTGNHPICYVPYIIGISAIGYVLLVLSEHLPGLGLLTCILIGVGMSACALIPLFALLMVKQYPSKFIVPSCIGLAMLAVIVQSVLLEAFRTSIVLLNLSYLVVVIVLAIIFVLFEPYLIYAMRRQFTEKSIEPEDPLPEESVTAQTEAVKEIETLPAQTIVSEKQVRKRSSSSVLTKREFEILDLISTGYTNKDIAKMLFISEYTVNDHTKNIYRKLGVHNRHAAAQMLSELKSSED